MAAIKFYFDFMSPYSCLTWQWLSSQEDLLKNTQLLPISMGSLISSFETKGPAQIPVKRDYLFKAALRAAKKNQLYLEIPYKLPFNSVLVQRLAQPEVAGAHQVALIDQIFRGIWKEGMDMEDPEELMTFLSRHFEVSVVEQLFEQSSSKEARLEQRKYQTQVKEQGAFGVPSFIVDQELFWGFDAREDLLSYLKKTDPLDQEKFQRFTGLFSS